MSSITKVLIANRGEIAVRVIRACRELGMASVAVFSDADRGALHVREADEAVRVGPPPSAESYLNIPALLEAAARTGADAVHPGYGFLSENAGFAQAVLDAGLSWIGPSPEAIAAMGDKVRARALMQAAGVPVVPGTEDVSQAARLGLPVLVKAAAGGGGRGMRLVSQASELEAAIAGAQREALGAFGDDRVFVERYVEQGRHIEVQVLGDSHGRVIALGERECSVQRRHQKVIEEAPSVAVSPALRARLEAAAVQAAEAVSYVGAGTVEFLYDEARGEFYFLEMNTRLQVEHPVTEQVTGVDLVRLQLEVAMGGRVPESVSLSGWSIEARLYAEDPAQGYLPQSGRLADLCFAELPGVRIDSGVETGDTISIHYDPMIAKVIASGGDREEARRRLVRALQRLSVLGITTNREQLLAILQHEDFVSGAISTRWLGEVALDLEPSPRLGRLARLCALASELSKPRALLPGVPKGWRNLRSRDMELSVSGEVLRWRAEGQGWRVGLGENAIRMEFAQVDDVTLRMFVDGHVFMARVVERGGGWFVHTPYGAMSLERDPVFPDHGASQDEGGCAAPMPGKVLRVEVEVGQSVQAGQALVVLEAMKMEQVLRAPRDGVIAAVKASVGEQVEAGTALIELEE
ncbi:MAG: ATP-grasp domain-containing protein [Alphaproteobacteria bacterium]|nr:ATP-grasp domain-containing protein [Alphaproteobacteria bacterium]MCB9796346.1 ATP-grasp domain-containing protein [Alphaproteobacteria bacterium]